MKHSTAMEYRKRLERVLRHIQHHVDEAISPDDLASIAHLSRFHFSRIFRGMVGESIGEHVRRLRLERAAGELRRTDRAIVDIAISCGYHAHEPFTRAFRGHFGCAPSEYRALDEVPTFPAAPSLVHYGPDDAVSRFIPVLQENPMVAAKIETTPAYRLAAVRHVGPYIEVGRAFQTLFGWASSRGMIGPRTVMIGVYHDDPTATPAEKLRSDAGITVPEGFEPAPGDPVAIVEIPRGECACALFKGPYERLGEAYHWFFGRWLPESGREPADRPPFEIYLNNPRDTRSDDLLTRICIPLL
ncbi:MAG: AraC family transcriptional regulator [Phycisphaeraceae bacterium]|nr:AraC family transcriptional regulator [Phycisphaeraceae bacterium]